MTDNMDALDETSVIHRKALAGRGEFDARAMSPAKALRLSLCRAAEQLFGLAVSVSTVEQCLVAHADIEAEMDGDGLLILLDGAESACGAMQFDIQFLASLIEVQTTGRVRPGPAASRPMTPTDGAIAAPLVDATLRGFDEQLMSADAQYRGAGYRFGDRVGDARTLSLTLEAPEYDLFRLVAEIGEGAKSGTLTLALPKQRTMAENAATGDSGMAEVAWLEQNALNAPVALNTILARVSHPLHSICELVPGSVLPVPPECLGETELQATQGHVVATVRLGQLNGFRAVQVMSSGGDSVDEDEARPNADQQMASNARDPRAVLDGAAESGEPITGHIAAKTDETAEIDEVNAPVEDAGVGTSREASDQGP